MSKGMKAAFLSFLVFPGLGQMVLRRYKRGLVFVLLVLGSFSVLVVTSVQKAVTILDRLQSAGKPIDLNTITAAAAEATTTAESFMFNLSLIVIAACWVLSTLDAYRIGRALECAEQSDRGSAEEYLQ